MSRQKYGFRNNHSTSLAIADLYENLLHDLDKKLISCAVFLDLRKAFESVNHSILLTQLEHYGVRGNALKLVQSYHSIRKQYVQGGIIKSSLNSILSGFPQGSILGPLFFNTHKGLSKVKFFEKYTFCWWYSFSWKRQQSGKITKIGYSSNDKSNGLANRKQTLTKYFQNKIYVDHKQTCKHWILCNKCRQ